MRAYTALLCVILFLGTNAQDTNSTVQLDDLVFRLNYHTGKISQKYIYPPIEASQYLEANVSWQTNGSKNWHHYYNFPEVGIGTVYGNHGNDSIYGSSIAIYPFWYYHILYKKYFHLDLRLACGFSYFFSPYDRFDNENNWLIGSHINNYTSFGILFRYKSPFHIDIYGGINFHHYSAAHTQIPNLGLNDRTITLGISYKPGTTRFYKEYKPDTTDRHKWYSNFRFGFGAHKFSESVHPAYGPSYPIYTGSYFLSRRIGNVSDLHLGLTASYYTSFYDVIRLEDWYPGSERLHATVISGLISHEFMFGHFGMIIEADIHFFNPFYKKYYAYNMEGFTQTKIKSYLGGRTGFIWYPLKKAVDHRHNLGIGIFLKTHLGQADFAEINISYSL